MLFDFVEDHRSNPHDYPETFLQTGHCEGVITINALEADDVAREAVRIAMNESYRTVLGHLHHESGHHFWSLLVRDEDLHSRFEAQFGDESRDYSAALEFYYSNGPAQDWGRFYISPYASAHPSEDWAERWRHYLHIFDAMKTAQAYNMIDKPVLAIDITERIAIWRDLSIVLNELNRSIGSGDAYPFVANTFVEEKLKFVDAVITRLRSDRSETARH